MSKKIEVKNIDVLRALIRHNWAGPLEDIIFMVAEKYGLCFTEGWRPATKPGDVHCTNPLRAIDLRSWFYEYNDAKHIEAEINRLWEYDYKRPEKDCAWIHNSGLGVHFHIQTHPNTRRRQ